MYQQETYNPDRQIVGKWRLTSFADGKFVIQHFDQNGINITHAVIWDGKYRRVVDFPTHTVMSYLMYPKWGAQQMTVLVKQATTKELKDEQLAEEAALGKPLVRGRVVELCEKVIAALPKLETAHPVAQKVAAQIRQRSEKAVSRFRT